METPSRHSFDLDGSTRVFPISSPIKGDNYCRLEVDGVVVNDRALYDIVNNSIVFLDASTVPANSQLDVLVVQSEEAIGQLSITFNIDIVASNIDDVNTVATDITSVNSVATDIANINSVVANLAGVLDSEANAAEAAADRLQTGLDVLTTNADAATSTTKANEASASATAASASAANAAASASTIDTNNILHTQGSGLPNEAYDKTQADSQFAPLTSPDLTGTPTAPTATAGDSSTQLATTEFVQDSTSSAVIGTKVAELAAGGVGSYAYLVYSASTNLQKSAGFTTAGSKLRYANMSIDGASSDFERMYFTVGGTVSGTWRLMGNGKARENDQNPLSIWLRIA